jgi:hypothetical protein
MGKREINLVKEFKFLMGLTQEFQLELCKIIRLTNLETTMRKFPNTKINLVFSATLMKDLTRRTTTTRRTFLMLRLEQVKLPNRKITTKLNNISSNHPKICHKIWLSLKPRDDRPI